MKQTYIRFMAPVLPATIDHLMKIIDHKIHEKYEILHLMISSPGGSVFHGLSIYNFLKGSPLQVHTYNFGSVDSIGVVIYCAGSRRFSVPHARFLIHGVKMNFSGHAFARPLLHHGVAILGGERFMRALPRTVPDVRARGSRSAGASRTAAGDGGLHVPALRSPIMHRG